MIQVDDHSPLWQKRESKVASQHLLGQDGPGRVEDECGQGQEAPGEPGHGPGRGGCGTVVGRRGHVAWPPLILAGKELAAVQLRLALEGLRLDGRVHLVERVHQPLDVGLVHLREEVLDAVLVLDVVKEHEPLPAGRNEAGNVP